MSRDYKVFLEDILEAIQSIQDYTNNLSQKEFLSDKKTIDAVIRNLEIIGEAVKQIPESIRHSYPYIEWKRIAGLRDILIHEYFGIDRVIIWDIVTNKIPILETHIRLILKD